MSISTIGILLIITIILLLIVIILVIFQFNKISLENARLQQIVSDEKQDMQSNIVLHTKNNFSEVAFSLGYEDYAYFSKLFKKASGLTPTDFLKNYK